MAKYGNTIIGICLILISTAVYSIDYSIYGDSNRIFNQVLVSLAFVPIQVLLVSMVLNQFIASRQKQENLRKQNMVIGAFFIEIGTELLHLLTGFLAPDDPLRTTLGSAVAAGDKQYDRTVKRLQTAKPELDLSHCDLPGLVELLYAKRGFLLGLLENANLLEHESFSDLLWSVSHVGEELRTRIDIKHLSEADTRHLMGDIRRVYVALVIEWLKYMKHLRLHYPYLYSLAQSTSPFDTSQAAQV